MKKDTEVRLLMQERRKGTPQRIAAARAGMSERTARKYEQAGQLPSQLKRPHTWVTRPNPFEEDWPWVVAQLQRDPARPRLYPVWTVVRAAPGPLPTNASPHAATTHCALACRAWAGARGHVRATAHAWGARRVRFHPHGGSGGHHWRFPLSPHGVSLGLDLLECGSRPSVL